MAALVISNGCNTEQLSSTFLTAVDKGVTQMHIISLRLLSDAVDNSTRAFLPSSSWQRAGIYICAYKYISIVISMVQSALSFLQYGTYRHFYSMVCICVVISFTSLRCWAHLDVFHYSTSLSLLLDAILWLVHLLLSSARPPSSPRS